ncbi:MAG: Rid family detoxifying hydrolase [Bacteroidales bacterium]|jgi:2-iminobutanoate/2-iminopropanoate deaminase|nr:Rid family detoxifying hydrolase [Bacteroidales bacterium]
MKKTIHTDNAPKAIGPYSQATEANGMLFISGQLPVNPLTGKIIDGGIKEQTAQSLANLQSILKEADYTTLDVVKCVCYLSEISNFAAMNEVYSTVFGIESPARAAFAVKELPMGALVEIEAIAVK